MGSLHGHCVQHLQDAKEQATVVRGRCSSPPPALSRALSTTRLACFNFFIRIRGTSFLQLNTLLSTQSPMARSFTNVKVFSARVANGFSNTTTRNGKVVINVDMAFLWEHVWVCSGGDDGDIKRNQRRCLHRWQWGSKIRGRGDPVIGYYRLENTNEIDVTDLRAMILGKTFNHYFPVPIPPLINLKS
ncbi:hypothetical protein V8G54_021239 [Vigna mungo]|uniref:Uncharacterized protein n=1 Tax=Vigna mungo TaxID=3915 RepID=A0AAQ3RWP7_VIGMU